MTIKVYTARYHSCFGIIFCLCQSLQRHILVFVKIMTDVQSGILETDVQWSGGEFMGNVLPAEFITDIMPFATPADTMSFTGRRPKDLCGYEASAYCQFVSDLTEVLSIFYSKGVRRFLLGGAQGMDQMAFWAVQRLHRCKEYPLPSI